jgi:hypothetical protein
MPEPFFNLGVQFITYREAKGMVRYNKVAKHHLDMCLCVSYIFIIKIICIVYLYLFYLKLMLWY